VTYWAAEQLGRAGSEKRKLAFSSPILPTPDETDTVLWFPLAKARKKLTYESDKRILDSFASQARELLFSGTLILLRHAKAEERKHWEGEEADRPITPRGAQDAYATTRELACFAPDTLVSSPWIRCIQTVNLYASLTHQRIIRDDRLTEAAFACKPDQALTAAADYLLQSAQTCRNIVVCLHRPVLGGIFKALKEHLKESGNHETADAIPSESPFLPTACALAITATLDGHTQKPKILNIQRLNPVVY
jgi:8-oxo-dGTP diphosphatase